MRSVTGSRLQILKSKQCFNKFPMLQFQDGRLIALARSWIDAYWHASFSYGELADHAQAFEDALKQATALDGVDSPNSVTASTTSTAMSSQWTESDLAEDLVKLALDEINMHDMVA